MHPTGHVARFLLQILVAAVAILGQPPDGGQPPVKPLAANKPTLTYLPDRRMALLFGGFAQRGAALDETWLLDNGCWTRLRSPGPPARGAHAAAYDAQRHRLVVFGGSAGEGKMLGDTWEFDGRQWEQRSTSGPPARARHRMAYDDKRKRVIMFGGTAAGITGPAFNDLWQWDGAAWTLVAQEGPPPRFESALVYDSTRETAILFGGNRGTGQPPADAALGDTWLMRGSIWEAMSGPGPSKRDHHAMAFHAQRGVTLLFGGWSGHGMLADTWVFDGRSWIDRTEPGGPSARGGVPAMTYDSDRHKVVMYGGWGDNGPLQDLWEWDGGWTAGPACGKAGPR